MKRNMRVDLHRNQYTQCLNLTFSKTTKLGTPIYIHPSIQKGGKVCMAYSLKTQKILHHNHKQEDKWGQDPCGSPWHSKIESRLGLQCWASLFTVIYKISFIRASAIIGGIDQAMSSCAPPTSRQYFFELMESRSHFKDFHLKQCKVLKTRSVRPTCQ